jgi:phosphate transport system protein
MSPGTGARHLAGDLDALKSRLLEMSALAEDLLRTAVEALAERDQEKADSVILGDRQLDALELELDEASLSILALHQPVARDLRFITMAMRISNDLERIGDHAVNVAEAVGHLSGQPSVGPVRELDDMARITRQMLTDALDAFIRGDTELARSVCSRDDQVDALQDSIFRILLTHMMENPRRIGPAMSLILVSRNLERIADLATNIGEDVVFLVKGQAIKHRHGAGEGEAGGGGGTTS